MSNISASRMEKAANSVIHVRHNKNFLIRTSISAQYIYYPYLNTLTPGEEEPKTRRHICRGYQILNIPKFFNITER